MYNKAIILEATDLDGALALYKQIVAINPKASTAYLRMAFVYAKQGQATQAEAARSKAIALDPSLAQYPLPAACAPNC
jgi:Tfp pilus assembly protein PilF